MKEINNLGHRSLRSGDFISVVVVVVVGHVRFFTGWHLNWSGRISAGRFARQGKRG